MQIEKHESFSQRLYVCVTRSLNVAGFFDDLSPSFNYSLSQCSATCLMAYQVQVRENFRRFLLFYYFFFCQNFTVFLPTSHGLWDNGRAVRYIMQPHAAYWTALNPPYHEVLDFSSCLRCRQCL